MIRARTAIVAALAAALIAPLVIGAAAVANGAPVRLALQLGPAQLQAELGLGREPRVHIRTGDWDALLPLPATGGEGRS